MGDGVRVAYVCDCGKFECVEDVTVYGALRANDKYLQHLIADVVADTMYLGACLLAVQQGTFTTEQLRRLMLKTPILKTEQQNAALLDAQQKQDEARKNPREAFALELQEQAIGLIDHHTVGHAGAIRQVNVINLAADLVKWCLGHVDDFE